VHDVARYRRPKRQGLPSLRPAKRRVVVDFVSFPAPRVELRVVHVIPAPLLVDAGTLNLTRGREARAPVSGEAYVPSCQMPDLVDFEKPVRPNLQELGEQASRKKPLIEI